MSNDQQARLRALDTTASFIIKAPAGSGKTQLLITRFLCLLLTVEKPQSILCVTFTKKAAGEIRERLHHALFLYQQPRPEKAHALKLWELSLEISKHAKRMQWCAQTLAARLSIMTIDATFQHFLHKAPEPYASWANFTLSTEPELLYRQVLDSFFQSIQSTPALQTPYVELLHFHRMQQSHIKALLLQLLSSREQWLSPLMQAHSADFLEKMQEDLIFLQEHAAKKVLSLLDAKHFKTCCTALDILQTLLRSEPALLPLAKRLPCIDYASITACPSYAFDKLQRLGQWAFTQSQQWKKRFTRNDGILPKTALKEIPQPLLDAIWQAQNQLLEKLGLLQAHPDLQSAFAFLLSIPKVDDPEQEWRMLKPLLQLLPLLAAYCQQVMQNMQMCDFSAIAMQVDAALQDEQSEKPLNYALYQQFQHLLIDEFQDTSQSQYRIFSKILEPWADDPNRTCVCVGDPMQSIYRFRQADVSLFTTCMQHGMGGIKLTPLLLESNYRSSHTLVEWNNALFSNLMPPDFFHQSTPFHTFDGKVAAHASVSGENEGDAIAQHIKALQKHYPNDSIAILIRSRSHLKHLLPKLKFHGIEVLAKDLDDLSQTQAGYDAICLTQLHHLQHKKAWLSLLRHPLLGLDWESLWDIVHSEKPHIWASLQDPPNTLSLETKTRIALLIPILQDHLTRVRSNTLILASRKTWYQLRGPEFVDTPTLEALEDFWMHCHTLENLHGPLHEDVLEAQLKKISLKTQSYAKNPLHIMTVHKAKGLEFDHVVLPCLQKKSPHDGKNMLTFMQKRIGERSMLWLHSYPKTQSAMSPMQSFLRQSQTLECASESDRVLYVALTRAKKTLYLSYVSKNCIASQTWLGRIGNALPPHPLINAPMLETCALQKPPPLGAVPILKEQRISTSALQTHLASPNDQIRIRSLASIEKLQDHTQWGTLVHMAMEYAHHHGLESLKHIAKPLKAYWQTLHLTASMDVQTQTFNAITKALHQLVQDPIAQWIFSKKHLQIKAEFPLYDPSCNRSYRIDRMFYDVINDEVWIVDFKTKLQHTCTKAANIKPYQTQLAIYLRLIKTLPTFAHKRLRAGVYFPLSKQWIVLAQQDFKHFESLEPKTTERYS